MAQRGKERFHSPAQRVVPVDTVGAGDSFDAGFLHQYVRGADITTCLASGNRAGALSTTRPGGTEAFRDREHKEKFFREANVRSCSCGDSRSAVPPDPALSSPKGRARRDPIHQPPLTARSLPPASSA